VLLTLLVLWVVVVPALTVGGTFVLSGVLGRRLRGRHERFTGTAGNHPAPARLRHAPVRLHRHAPRSRGGDVLVRH
jgi:hypothetical protein